MSALVESFNSWRGATVFKLSVPTVPTMQRCCTFSAEVVDLAKARPRSQLQNGPARYVQKTTLIERIFEKYMGRKMTSAERELFHLKPE
jgi:hypothetical protein